MYGRMHLVALTKDGTAECALVRKLMHGVGRDLLVLERERLVREGYQFRGPLD